MVRRTQRPARPGTESTVVIWPLSTRCDSLNHPTATSDSSWSRSSSSSKLGCRRSITSAAPKATITTPMATVYQTVNRVRIVFIQTRKK
jgi:hypothetical protein